MILDHAAPSIDSDIHPAPFKDFISPKARKIIFWTVVGSHIGMIFLPLLLFMFIKWIMPQPKVIKVINVSLFNDLPFDHRVQSKAPDPNNPTPSDTVPPPPGEISPLPPEPVEEEPAPSVKETPKPKEKPKEIPKPKDSIPNPEAKAKPKDKPKEDPKAKDDGKSKKLTADDIKKASTVVKGAKPKTTPKGMGGQFFNNLNKNLNLGKYDPNARPGGGTNGGQGVQGNPDQDSEYYGRVGAYLKSRWQQPSRALIGGSKPSVNIKMRVDERGQIISATIERRSGVQVMDASVERLLAEVKALPVPPHAMEFTITMNIEDE